MLAGEFKLQSDVAERVARALDVALRPHESRALATRPTDDPLAYDDYLKGRFFWNKTDCRFGPAGSGVFQEGDSTRSKFVVRMRSRRSVHRDAELHRCVPDSTWLSEGERKQGNRTRFDARGAHAVLGTIFRNHHQWADAEREFKRAWPWIIITRPHINGIPECSRA